MTMPHDPFESLQPCDGYTAVRTEVGDDVRIDVVAFHGGVPVDDLAGPAARRLELGRFRANDGVDEGNAARLFLLAGALCRYFNTGGSWEELDRALPPAREAMPVGLSFLPFVLADSQINEEGRGQHVFVDHETDRVVVWVEGAMAFRRTTVDALAEAAEADEIFEDVDF